MVKFLKSFRNFNVGDVAGFSKQHEAWLSERNIAERQVKKGEETDMAKSAGNEKPPVQKDDPGAPKTRQTVVGPQTRK